MPDGMTSPRDTDRAEPPEETLRAMYDAYLESSGLGFRCMQAVYRVALAQAAIGAPDLTDEQILEHWNRRDECLHGSNAVIWFARAIQLAALAAPPVAPQTRSPDHPAVPASEEKKDAARYRWLRDKAPGEIAFDHTKNGSGGGNRYVLYVPFDGRPIDDVFAPVAEPGRALGDAIDAAIKEQA